MRLTSPDKHEVPNDPGPGLLVALLATAALWTLILTVVSAVLA